MSQNSLQTTEKPQAQSTTGKLSRLFFIDHLRVALTILVVLHHVAIVYGASSPFYYIEPPFTNPRAFQALLVFVLVNQAWFMGVFFLLAGYFTPGSYDRKGTASFLKGRLLRLGIPTLLFIFILGPISNLGLYLMPASLTGITTSVSLQDYPDLISLGPLWFVVMLLLFNIIYAAWRMLTKNRPSSTDRGALQLTYLGVGIFVLVLALVSYLFRQIVAIGDPFYLFTDSLSFPSIGYLPQYLSFFALGIIASRNDWLRTMPNAMGIAGLITAIVGGIFLFPLAISGQWFSIEITEVLDNAMGNGHWQSAIYALWDSIFAVGLFMGLVAFFRFLFNRQSKFGTFLASQSYAVYVIHIPLIVFLAYLLRNITLGSLLKFGLASVIVVPICFLVAYAIRKVPGVASIL